MRAGARKVVSDSDNRVMSLIVGYRRSPTESEKRDNSVVRHPFPPGGAAQKREVGENNIWATWPLLADIFSKVPNCPAPIFLLSKNQNNDRRSMWPQSRYRGRQ